MSDKNRVAVVGVGFSEVGRSTSLSYKDLTLQAATAAMADAGMSPKDIDGVSVECGASGPERADSDPVTAAFAANMLGIEPLNWWLNFNHPQIMSIAAIKAGLCHTVLDLTVLRAMMSTREQVRSSSERQTRVYGDQQFTQPFGSLRAAQNIAGLAMQRHMGLYGTTEEQFGLQQVTQRYHASMNDNALMRAPITLEDYLNSRWISKPARILDCDYPCFAGSAIIFTTEERARQWKTKPIFIESYAQKTTRGDFFDLHEASPGDVARELWSQTDLKPKDVDCAMLYDGFSVLTFIWLEAMGFVKPGESGPFVEAGNTRLGGSLPVNTDGGVCNVGRRHGASHLIEAVKQLRRECGVRQVPNAKVSCYTVAAGPTTFGAIVTAD